MINPYIAIGVMLGLGLLVGFGGLVASLLLGPSVREPQKDLPYECGIDPVGDAAQPFPVKFFVVALMFLVFDVEVVLLYPWASAAGKLGVLALVEALVFLGVLLWAYLYVLSRGGLRWVS